MKPYAGYKGNNLTDIVATAIAFVNQGANKKPFFLFKRKDGNGMDKSKAIELIKSGKLNEGEMDAMVSAVPESDQEEVKKVADEEKKKLGNNVAVEKMVETIVEKVGSKLSKDTITKLNEISGSLKGIASKLDGMTAKDIKTDKKGDKTDDPEREVSEEEFEKMVEDELGKDPEESEVK